jgi:hypothetical protein
MLISCNAEKCFRLRFDEMLTPHKAQGQNGDILSFNLL